MSSISVVIPARNPGQFLAESLGSVAAQTRLPTSIVVVDDGSVDDVVVDTVARFPGATLIRQEPLGCSTARNRGAAATDSDFLLFLDADDLLRPEALMVMGAALDADPSLDIVHGRVFEFVDHRYPPPPGVRSRDANATVRLSSSTLLRRSVWKGVGGFDEQLLRGEWIEWMSRAIDLGLASADVEEVVLERRLHKFNKSWSGGGKEQYLAAVVRGAVLRKRQRASELANR
jgi:glycosyltransferase involved in cell wall biosynthesis